MNDLHPGHFVCIFGGAVAGSEAAHRLAQRGIYSAVFDQDALPYGKIEHGLPKWHIKLRDKEESQIDEKIDDPHVFYVPRCKLGTDIDFQTVQDMGFTAILLATGAWRDRPLPVEGVDHYENKGFYYQNAFVGWFNQYHSPDYQGPQMQVEDGAIVVGGGLASLDVIKILMLETTLRAMKERGLETNLFDLEKKGIPKVLESLGVSWGELGLKGSTLYYRRRTLDMPLNEISTDLPPDRQERMKLVREKLMNNFQSKYLFDFEPCHVPVGLLRRGDRLAGLRFQRTQVDENGKARPIEGTEYDVSSPLVISSIGSLPEPIPGLPMKWNLLQVEDEETGKLEGFDNVFALGNAVTGRGNIRASLVHGRQVADHVMDDFLAWSEDDYRKLLESAAGKAGQRADKIADELSGKCLKTPSHLARIVDRIKRLQQRQSYDNNYAQWARKNAYKRLEDQIGYRG
ncbi:MAG TPA: FAD-dependent oxidoreductase [Acidobacteriota bacterium]|nr:FAD-dependent oxidoreductase [Acidobacteriota bacterium]